MRWGGAFRITDKGEMEIRRLGPRTPTAGLREKSSWKEGLRVSIREEGEVDVGVLLKRICIGDSGGVV